MDELVKFSSIDLGGGWSCGLRSRSLAMEEIASQKSNPREMLLPLNLKFITDLKQAHLKWTRDLQKADWEVFLTILFFFLFGFFWAQGGSREGKRAGGCRQTVRWELWRSWTGSERRKCLRSGRHGCSRRPRHARIMASYLSSLSLAWTQNRSRRYHNCSARFDCGPTTWRGLSKTGTNSQDSSSYYQSQWASHAPLFVIVLTQFGKEE